MARVGNPDIRVSQRVKIEDGQRAPEEKDTDGAIREKESTDGAGIAAEDADEQGNASRNIPEDERLAEEATPTPRAGPTEGQRSREQQRLRHPPVRPVPRGYRRAGNGSSRNLDIRVSQKVKIEDGQRAPEEKDAD
ncbi:hypothetical protein NDU88_003342 [Pleurodeles waltl]|uniref:Uncharacterized protein n=1 Tax=Pleurodeles waltl TaxID=8319 RepID=A0AAV7UY72_PLEWA|nr:hypothetical protein NDU88_003342 [Pleurodeles waltl]